MQMFNYAEHISMLILWRYLQVCNFLLVIKLISLDRHTTETFDLMTLLL